MNLTENQKLFADEYLIDLNATRAYKAAFKSCKKDETANVNGSRALRIAKVDEYIQKRMKDREKRTEITQDSVLKELARVALANGSDYGKIVSQNGFKCVELFDTDTIDPDKKAAIAGIKQGANGIEIKLHDKVKALELLGRHLGMFTDNVKITGQMTLDVSNLSDEQLDLELKKLGL